MLLIRAACWVSTNQHHRGIRKKQGAGVIEAWVSVHSRGTETVRIRIVQVGIPACGCCILIVRRSADGQDSAVRQDRRIHFGAGLRHRRSVLPLHRRRAEIDDFRRCRGRVAAAENHHARSVSVGGSQRQQDRRSIRSSIGIVRGCDDGRPRVRRCIEDPGACARTGIKNIAVGHQVHARIKRRRPSCRILLAPT